MGEVVGEPMDVELFGSSSGVCRASRLSVDLRLQSLRVVGFRVVGFRVWGVELRVQITRFQACAPWVVPLFFRPS